VVDEFTSRTKGNEIIRVNSKKRKEKRKKKKKRAQVSTLRAYYLPRLHAATMGRLHGRAIEARQNVKHGGRCVVHDHHLMPKVLNQKMGKKVSD
jgi:hypothetical protein